MPPMSSARRSRPARPRSGARSAAALLIFRLFLFRRRLIRMVRQPVPPAHRQPPPRHRAFGIVLRDLLELSPTRRTKTSAAAPHRAQRVSVRSSNRHREIVRAQLLLGEILVVVAIVMGPKRAGRGSTRGRSTVEGFSRELMSPGSSRERRNQGQRTTLPHHPQPDGQSRILDLVH